MADSGAVEDKWAKAFSRGGASDPAPRRSDGPSYQTESAPSAGADGDDKWSKVFSKNSGPDTRRGFGGGASNDARSGGFGRGFGGDRGGDRNFGGDRGGDRNFGGDRGGDRGFGGDRGGDRGFGGDRGGDRNFGGDRGGDRNFGGDRGGDRGFGGDRGGDRGGFRGGPRRGEEDVIDDPRFAGKFTSSGGRGGGDRGGDRGFGGDRGGDRGFGGDRGGFGGDRGGDRGFGGDRGGDRGGYRGNDSRGDRGGDRGGRGREGYGAPTYSADAPLPTGPRSAQENKAPVAAAPAGPTPAELRAAAEAEQKAAKAAKKLEREEADRKAKEAKAAAAAEAAAAQEKAKTDQAIALAAATDALATGLKGSALLVHVNSVPVKPTGAAILKGVLGQVESVTASKWWVKEEFGDALQGLLANSAKAQVEALYAVQAYCHEKKFPKVEVKGKPTKVIEVIFAVLMNSNIVDPDSFVAWADDDNAGDVGGRVDAIVQTTSFIQSIRDLDLQEFDDDADDDDDIDAPREYVK